MLVSSLESTASANSPALTNVVKRKRSILPSATMNKIAEISGPALSRSGRVSINSDSNGKAVLGTESITRIGSSKQGHRTTHRRMSSQASVRSQTAERRTETRSGFITTIQFTMESSENNEVPFIVGWVNTNPVISFLETLEWACSRLQSSIRKNDLAFRMECLQFPRLCRARYITYNRLAELSSTGQVQNLRMDNISSSQSQMFGKKYQNGEKQLSFNPVSRFKLVFEVSFAVSSSGKKLPELRLRKLIKCASARGPVLSKPQGDYILENAVTTFQDKSLTILFQVPFIVGWVNTNPVISFLETLEWACSRLQSSIRKNDLAFRMECLQFPRLCRARYITYNRLAELSSTGQVQNLRMDNISSSQSQMFGKKYQNGEKQLSFNPVSRFKLVFEVSFAVSSSGKKLPELRLRKLIKCASARGPVLSKPQGDYILENAVTTFQDKSVNFIRSGLKMAAVLHQLAMKFDCAVPASLRPHNLTGVSLNKLVELLKFQRKSLKNKTTGDQDQLRLPNWLSYSCDGTLTICYPTGHIAVIWTPSPKKYAPPVNVQPTDCPDSDSSPRLTKQSTSEPMSIRRKAMPANTKRIFPVRQSPVDTNRPFWPQNKSRIEQTGFYLFLFDPPPDCDPANVSPSCTLASTAFKDSADPTSTSELDGPNNTGQKHLPESRLLKKRESVNKPSVETNVNNMLNVEENFPASSYLKHQQTSPTALAQVGQMLAHFTPSGEGVIFSSSNVHQIVDEKPVHLLPNCNLHVVFTPTMNYMFQPTGHPVSQHFPYALKSQTADSTTRLPSTLNIQLNKYLTFHCTSSTDLAVIFRVDKYVELKIFCHQPQEKEQNAQHSYGRRLLSKLPFLNASVDTPSGRPIPMSRKRREEAFQRLFKGLPSLESDEYLRRHLQKASEEITVITENWLTFLRTKLRLHRLRSSSRSPIRKAVLEVKDYLPLVIDVVFVHLGLNIP
ncbi:hypothetical protein AHF37_06496 [Paragonimus kellicotti]|nr:hypothetical protein AHF37_06496 [Paragonimus kellicotti]